MSEEKLRKQLASIKVLWRQHNGPMALWGIPYFIQPGQTPPDLFDGHNAKDWVWLGMPGWWGRYQKHEQEIIEKFLNELDVTPDSPGEFVTLGEESILKEFKLTKKAERGKCRAARCKNESAVVLQSGLELCQRHYDKLREDEREADPIAEHIVEGGGSSLPADVENTPIGANDRDVITAEIELAKEETTEALASLEHIEITSSDLAELFDGLLQDAHEKIKALDGRRKKLKAPILEAGREVDALFKPAISAFEALKTLIKSKLRTWYIAQEQAQQNALDSGDGEQVALTASPETSSGTTPRKTWQFEVENIGIVPREFLIVNETAVREELNRVGPANARIPGIRFFQDVNISVKRSS